MARQGGGRVLGSRWSLHFGGAFKWSLTALTPLDEAPASTGYWRHPLSLTPSPRDIKRAGQVRPDRRLPCSPSRYAFWDRCAARDPDPRDSWIGQRLWSEQSTSTGGGPASQIASQQGMGSLDGRCLIERNGDQRFRWSGPVWSPPPESNRRPHPYHGTTRNRCANRRFPRSRPTVGAKVIGSLSEKLCVLFGPCAGRLWRKP
jgi:hypothetical protein